VSKILMYWFEALHDCKIIRTIVCLVKFFMKGAILNLREVIEKK
jgi:hypothetical protein